MTDVHEITASVHARSVQTDIYVDSQPIDRQKADRQNRDSREQDGFTDRQHIDSLKD